MMSLLSSISMMEMKVEKNNNAKGRSASCSEILCQNEKTLPQSPQSPDVMNRADKSLITYGVKYLNEKPDKLRLLRINSKSRLFSYTKPRKSQSDLDSGFDSTDSCSASGSSTGNASSPTSSESSVTLDTESLNEEYDWTEFKDYPFENLAMSGGGAKGYAYIGALKAFEDAGLLPNLQRIVGTSAGAVIGGMLAVNATPQEIADFFSCDVKKLFQDKNATMCLFLPRLLTKFGVNSGQRFYEIYGDFLARKTGDPDITFNSVYRIYRKELCVTVTNLSRMCSEYCHYTTTPDLPIRMAIKISMAFPGVYESMKTDLFGTGTSLYVDGGTLENFPVQYFDDIDDDTGKPIYNDKTIGLYLMSEDQFSHKIWQETFNAPMEPFPTYLPDTKLAKDRLKDEIRKRKKKDRSFDGDEFLASLKQSPYIMADNAKTYMRHFDASNKELIDIKGPKHYFKAMLSTLLISQKHMMVQPSDLERTVGINTGYIDTKDTGIEPGDREFMIRQGYEQTRNFLIQYSKKKQRKSHLKSHQQTHDPRHSHRPSSLSLSPSTSKPVKFFIDQPSPDDVIPEEVPEIAEEAVQISQRPVQMRHKSSSVDSNNTLKPEKSSYCRISSTVDLSDSIFTKL